MGNKEPIVPPDHSSSKNKRWSEIERALGRGTEIEIKATSMPTGMTPTEEKKLIDEVAQQVEIKQTSQAGMPPDARRPAVERPPEKGWNK